MLTAESSPRESVARQAATPPYTDGVRRSRQLKTTDFIPKRLVAVSGLASVMILAVLALNGVHYAVPSLEPALGAAVVSAFSLDSLNGINAWYCNCLLLLSGATCLQIWLLRQHRRDDYRGTYRLWLWFAAVFLVSSMATVTSVSNVLNRGFQNLAGLDSSSAFWPALILFTMLTALIARAFLEVRQSRLAVGALTIVFLGYGGSLLLNLFPEFSNRVSFVHSEVQGNLILIAASALLFGTIGFARYVYLEAMGLTRIPDNRESRGVRKSDRKKNKRAEKEQTESTRTVNRRASADGSDNQSGNRHQVTGTSAKLETRTTGKESPDPHLLKRSERHSGRPDNRVGSGQKLDRSRFHADSDEDSYTGLSKSELRRLRKQKRRAS